MAKNVVKVPKTSKSKKRKAGNKTAKKAVHLVKEFLYSGVAPAALGAASGYLAYDKGRAVKEALRKGIDYLTSNDYTNQEIREGVVDYTTDAVANGVIPTLATGILAGAAATMYRNRYAAIPYTLGTVAGGAYAYNKEMQRLYGGETDIMLTNLRADLNDRNNPLHPDRNTGEGILLPHQPLLNFVNPQYSERMFDSATQVPTFNDVALEHTPTTRRVPRYQRIPREISIDLDPGSFLIEERPELDSVRPTRKRNSAELWGINVQLPRSRQKNEPLLLTNGSSDEMDEIF